MDVLDIEERRETNTLKQIEWREGGIEINTTYIYRDIYRDRFEGGIEILN